MKRRLLSIATLFVFIMLMAGCSSTTSQIQNEDTARELANAPKWVLNPTVKDKISAVGIATIGKAGMSFAKTKALANARDEIARIMGIKVKNLIKSFTQTTGIGDEGTIDDVSSQVSKQVASQVISGSNQEDVWISPSNNIYVLVVVDNNLIKETVKNSAKSSYGNDEALWQLFQAKNAHEDLDKEIEKEFNDFKKSE